MYADISGSALTGAVLSAITWGGSGPVSGQSAVSLAGLPVGGGALMRSGTLSALPVQGGAFSIEFWIKQNNSGSVWMTPLGWGTLDLDHFIAPDFHDSGTAADSLEIYDDDSGYAFTTSGGAPTHDGAWHHIVIATDGTTTTFYQDGVALPTSGSAWDSASYTPETVALGSAPDGWGGTLFGGLAQVAIYDSALDATRVLAHYRASGSYRAEVLTDAPVAYWPLTETSGLTFADLGPHGYDVSAPPPPEAGVAGPFASSNAVRFRLGGAVTGTPAPGALPTILPLSVDGWIKMTASRMDPWTFHPLLSWGYQHQGWYDLPSPMQAQIAVTLRPSPSTCSMTVYVWWGTGASSRGSIDLTLSDSSSLLDAWHHVGLTWDTSRHMRAYLDGAETSSQTLPLGWDATGPDTADPGFSIGGMTIFENLANADIAYVALYPSALSSGRMAAHAAATTDSGYRSAVLADSPSGFWPLQET